MLDQQTTLSLLKKVKNNDERAKEELIINNIQLVKSIVRKYKYSQVEYDDLMQLGLIGLYKAIKNFEPDKQWVKDALAKRDERIEAKKHKEVKPKAPAMSAVDDLGF